MTDPHSGNWPCGAFQPIGLDEQAGQTPYRCTDPAGHKGTHKAVIDGETVAEWALGATW